LGVEHDKQLYTPWSLPACLQFLGHQCDVYQIQLDRDAAAALLIVDVEQNGNAVIMKEITGNKWAISGRLSPSVAGCDSLRKELVAGNFKMVPSRESDLEVAGKRIEINSEQGKSKIFECKNSVR